jgi:hypothetical protein
MDEIKVSTDHSLYQTAFGNYGLAGVVLASSPDKAVMDANTYISYLDGLRRLGQTEAGVAQARHARDVAVFDHTSYLDALRNEAAAMQTSDSNQVVSRDANSFISYLDHLRTMGSAWQMDAATYITHLDQLRQKGFNVSETGSAQLVSR